MKLNKLTLAVAMAFAFGANATSLDDMPWVRKKAPIYEYKPSSSPVVLSPVATLSRGQLAVVSQAQAVMQNKSVESLILLDRGKIVFESYQAPITDSSPQFSWSMSKSLTAYNIGSMHCQKQIPDLDLPAATYAKELRGTVFGDASVRNLLTMSSGLVPGNKGSRSVGEFGHIVRQNVSMLDYLIDLSQPTNAPGSVFSYSNPDTMALSMVADSTGNFLENFDNNFWQKIGAEAPGYWALDKGFHPITYAGFAATTRDWGRLAMYTIKLLKGNDSCMRNYMQQATTTQMMNNTSVGISFKGYGYQTWTNNKFDNGKTFWWTGHDGQRVAIDPVTEKIMIVTSQNELAVLSYYRLFAQFQRTN